MNDIYYKKTGRIVGILFIIGTVAGVLCVPFLSSLKAPNYLVEMGNNVISLQIGAILLLIMAFSLAMVPAFMYPILKEYNEPLGIGYIIFRSAVETCTVVISVICLLLLSSLGAEYVAGGMQNTDRFQTLGGLLNTAYALPVSKYAWGVGAIIFYIALYKYKLIPRWISGWGLIAITLSMVSFVLVLFGLQEDFDTASLIMNLPIAVQEMVMAVWFITKGFQITDDTLEGDAE